MFLYSSSYLCGMQRHGPVKQFILNGPPLPFQDPGHVSEVFRINVSILDDQITCKIHAIGERAQRNMLLSKNVPWQFPSLSAPSVTRY